MDIKIKKEGSNSERNLEIPNFKSSSEINKELDQVEFKEHNVSPKDTMKFEKHEDDLELTTQFITTEFNTDNFETLEVDTIDLEQDIQQIEAEYHKPEKRDEDTIKINKSEYIELEDSDELPPVKREFAINIKFLYGLLILIVIAIVIGSSYTVYNHVTSDEKFVSQALETPFAVENFYVYGESANIITDSEYSKVELYSLDTDTYIPQQLGKSIDEQLHFSSLADGTYYLFIDDKIATSNSDLNISFQTITRDDVNKDVKITTDDQSVVEINISTATDKQVDILIDASQGDVQGFTASDGQTTEQQLSLKYALALKSSLQTLGYNVEVTRDEDVVPGDCNYQDPYCETGRVAMAYKNNPKLYIQIGFNGENGSGFEITDSYLNSHTFARILKSSLITFLSPSERISGQLEPGVYVKTYDVDDRKVDYLYLIRETGGAIMDSDNQDASEFNQQPVGTEAIAVDLGYISESTDFEQLNTDAEIDNIAKAMAAAIDQYVNQY